MAYGLTPEGYKPKPLTVIKTEIDEALKGVFGESIGSEADGSIPAASAFGQISGIFAERESLIWELGSAIASAFNPDAAEQAVLDALCAITGTVRKPQSFSKATLTATGTANTALPKGRVVAVAGASTRFDTLSDVTIAAATAWAGTTAYVVGNRRKNASRIYLCITSGTSAGSGGPTTTAADITDGTVHWRYLGEGVGYVDVLVQAESPGALAALSGTLTEIKTPVSGWQSAINILDATVGALVESDADLRTRRELELSGDALAQTNAIRRVVLDTTDPDGTKNVETVTVFQNLTLDTDGDGVPARSIEVMVDGGDTESVRAAVFASVGAGVYTHGNSSGTVVDDEGNSIVVRFSRPTLVPVYVGVTLYYTPGGAYPTDGDAQVKGAIVALGDTYRTGKDVSAWALGAVLDGIPGVWDVVSVKIGLSASPTLSDTLVFDKRSRPTFDSSRVTVTSSAVAD